MTLKQFGLIIWHAVVIGTIITLVTFVAWKVATAPKSAWETKGQQQCEKLGGIFYGGGVSADNCVFPPNK